MDLEALLKDYLTQQHMLQLATVRDGLPWICTVYFVNDDHLNFYWASLPTRRHSQEIKADPHVAAAIAVKYVNGQKVVGIQMEGVAEEVVNPSAYSTVIKDYAKRFGRDSNWIDDFSAAKTDHRLYKLTPSSIFLFDEVHFPTGSKQQVR